MADCRIYWIGRIGYRDAWKLQQLLAEKRLKEEIPDTLLLLEHPPTITLGRGANPLHVTANASILRNENVEVIESDRGGDVTYHGPGQLVGYPILNLRAHPHRPDLHLYLRDLEAAIIGSLAPLGIQAGRVSGLTGVWKDPESQSAEKIAAIGIRVSRWITQHGFALNVDPNMSHFDFIVPCGIRDHGVTSLSRILNRSIEIQEVIPLVVDSFSEVFGLDCTLGCGLPACGII